MSDWRIISPFDSDDTNECANPSLEDGTTGHAASGTNTIAASTEQQYRGRYSLKCTHQNNTTLDTIAHTFGAKSTTYYLKCKVYIPSSWDGGTLSISTTGYTSATTTAVTTWSSSPTATWVELKSTIALDTDEIGSILVVTTGSPTAGRYIYLDAFYISTNDGEYFDGEDDFAHWEGNRHLSASVMDARNRKHGKLYDPADTGVKLNFPSGVDFTPQGSNYYTRVIGDGAEYQGTKRTARPVLFPVIVPAASDAAYHSAKRAFENLIKLNRSPGQQSLRLQYRGANADVPAYLDLRTEGFEIVRSAQSKYTGFGDWRATAQNPQWYEAGDRYAALTRSQSLSVSYLLGFLNESGFDNLNNNGTGQVRTLAIDVNNDVIIGGQFLNWGGNADADNIARYVRSTDTWTSLFTAGANSTVNKVLILDDGRMVIVGAFTSIGGTAANRVAIWNGSAITALGTGFNAECYTVEYDYRNNCLYFGGAFTTANGTTVNYIAKYDLVAGAFSALDSGTNSDVRSIYVQPSGNLLVGGEFTQVGSPAFDAYHIARYKVATSEWNALATGTGASSGANGAVYSITVGDNNKIYIGGDFTAVGGRSFNNVAWRYIDSPAWFGLNNGVTGGLGIPVEYMYWDSVLNKLLISGQFDTVSIIGGTDVPVDQAVYWNGSSFEFIGLDFPASSTVYNFVRNQRTGDYFIAFDTTGTMVVPSATTTVTNNGTDDAPLTLHFIGGGSTGSAYAELLFVLNETTGARLSFNNLTLNEGSEIVIDLRPGKTSIKRIVGQTVYDITEGTFARESDTASFRLAPGANKITVAAADVNGSPTITAFALWRNHHNTISGTAA